MREVTDGDRALFTGLSDEQIAAIIAHDDELEDDHTVTSENIVPLQANMRIRIDFDNHYTYLKRATLADGLYFINLVTTKSSLKRNDGMYIVANHRGNLMYDSPTTYQN